MHHSFVKLHVSIILTSGSSTGGGGGGGGGGGAACTIKQSMSVSVHSKE